MGSPSTRHFILNPRAIGPAARPNARYPADEHLFKWRSCYGVVETDGLPVWTNFCCKTGQFAAMIRCLQLGLHASAYGRRYLDPACHPNPNRISGGRRCLRHLESGLRLPLRALHQ